MDVGWDRRSGICCHHPRRVEQGINIIDTAPVYGFGHSEEIVGKAITDGHLRSEVLIATKTGLEWKDEGYFVMPAGCESAGSGGVLASASNRSHRHLPGHWPDPLVRIEETAEAMHTLFKQGKIRAIGVSNFSVDQMEQFRRVAPLHVLQPPYNLFERGIEADILPYCHNNKIATLGYGALCRGLLSGRMRRNTVFDGDDLRRADPKFLQAPVCPISGRRGTARPARAQRFGKRVIHLAVRWMLDKVSPRRCGARATPASCSQSTR